MLATLSALALGQYAAVRLIHGLMPPGDVQLGDDFIIFWLGAKLALAGHASQAYDAPQFYHLQQAVVGPAAAYKICSYPAVVLLLCGPIGLLPFVPALAVWVFGGIALCAALLSRLVGWRLALLAAIGAPAAFLNLASGQNGYFTAAAFGGGLLLLERRPLLAGLCFGGLCYKPHLAVLLPFALLAGRQWRAVVGAGLMAGLLVAASLALFGWQTWAGSLHQMAITRELLEAHQNLWCSRVPTVFSALRQAGAPVSWAYAGQIVSALAAAVAVVSVWRSRAAMDLKAAILILAAFLASPYARDYDMVVQLFAVGWFVRDAARADMLPSERLVAFLLPALPALMLAVELSAAVQIAPIVLWLAFAVMLRRCFADSARGALPA